MTIKSFFESLNTGLLNQVKEYAKSEGYTLEELTTKSQIKTMPEPVNSIGFMTDIFELIDLMILNTEGKRW